jgi:hypothetical protein
MMTHCTPTWSNVAHWYDGCHGRNASLRIDVGNHCCQREIAACNKQSVSHRTKSPLTRTVAADNHLVDVDV